MSEDARQVFRIDNEVMAFRFTATVSDRAGTAPRERLDSPARLKLWLTAAEFDVAHVSSADLHAALELREAIYRAGTAIAAGKPPHPSDIHTLNRVAAAGHAKAALGQAERAEWRLTKSAPVRDALGVLATNAIQTLGAPTRNRIKTCEGPHCAGLYLDTSRASNRRWCSMNTCGNKVKKSRLRPTQPH
ncbi:hypothetical protein D7D52_13705 [Nocardia yunnanensis]|uniref:Zinc finger CGNR domain-containing protein n=1 Tax=Nocardia yunnanensis TaxID=2382165 RepID=A0A386ZBT1_9NOCA|nr:ABATE domain-containing protein [Nocardia yunnanensis]AYF74747.1 hypothetical protein D7D52_13705 [Nocardia yunnanensis]